MIKCRATSRIIFEILENESVENYEEMAMAVMEFKSLGVKVAIDDFGSGYSNFSHVLQLGIDYIKIDGSLIKNITTDKQSEILVRGIVDFSKRLEIKTIAEYVENREIFEKLRLMGIDYAQGYYIGRPSPAMHT